VRDKPEGGNYTQALLRECENRFRSIRQYHAFTETGKCALSNGGFPQANTRMPATSGYSMFLKHLSLCSWQ